MLPDYYKEELYHYGVLGMKWGVRRGNYSKAFTKAYKKRDKLEKKAVKTNLKSAKLQKKGLKKGAHATSERKFQKAQKIQYKATKLNLKSAKLQKKGMKWQKSMEKTFANVKVSDVSPEAREAGKKYVYMLMDDRRD